MIPPRRSQIDRGPMPGRGRLKLIHFLRMRGLAFRLKTPAMFVRSMLLPWLQARRRLLDLDHLTGPRKALAKAGTIVVAAHYGDHALVEAFLAHHRRLGIKDFVFLDVSREGGLAAILAPEASCAVWRPRDFDTPGRISYWLNGLRALYAVDRWCLSLDTSDAFVFYRCETRKLADFTEFLDSESRDHCYALVVEMYGDKPAADLARTATDPPPVGALTYFDPLGFVTQEPGQYRNVVVRGGIQRRSLFPTKPRQSPALNRIPLVRWQWYYAYVAGTRLILPMHLNNPHSAWHSSPTACILRFALLQDRPTLEWAATWEAQTIARESGHSCYQGLSRLLATDLKQDISRIYTGSADLVECGLLNPGQWF